MSLRFAILSMVALACASEMAVAGQVMSLISVAQ